MADETKTRSSNATIVIAIWAAVLLTVFVAFRSSDLLKLPSLLGNLGGGPLFGGEGILASVVGAVVSGLILVSWLGIGSFVFRYLKIERVENHSHLLELIRNIAVGAIVTSLIWFFLGLAGLYTPLAAIIITVVGFVEGGLSLARLREPKTESERSDRSTRFDKALLILLAIPVVLAFFASLAPPIAKDTLLYHFSVPKAYIAQGSNAFIEGNIASYLALGTEMHAVWAMLLGNFVSTRAGEAAAGATTFLFFPLLLAAVFGWARELNVSRRWSLVAMLMVAAIPTAFHVASSGYIDLSLSLYVTLAVYSLTRFWKSLSTPFMVLIAVFLGGALAVKLTTVFVIAAFALIILLRARNANNPVAIAPGSDTSASVATMSSGKIVAMGFGALLLAGVIASPWYLRTWSATGSPVFPFYMSIWKGAANGWDVERSNLFQAMNSQYGGADIDKTNYLTSPLRLSLAAQPENPGLYDGVLGAAFLIGLPMLIWAIWRKKLADEMVIAAGVAGIFYVFWLFSGPQLRYLLPITPLLAIAIVRSIESADDAGLKAASKYSLLAASVLGILTSAAWFCQKAPLRVVLGGETRDQYLTRNLDYYPYYQDINNETAADARVWLINMRRDSYHIDRPYLSDYIFEDWTLRKMVWESRNTAELKAKAAATGVKYILTRHDFLFDLDKSTLVDEKKSRPENEAKLRMAKELILDPANTVRADSKFSLVKVF